MEKTQRAWAVGTIGLAILSLTASTAAQPASSTTAGASPQAASAQTAQPPDQQTPSAPSSQRPEPSISPVNDRIFWTLPNYLTVENAERVPRLTVGGKFRLTAKDSLDPVEFPFAAIVAGIGQAQNSEPSYKQGLAGYTRRYATAFADNTVGNFMTEAVFPSLLHQDPRYFQIGKGGFLRRTGYALSRLLITRADSGLGQPNYSEVIGNMAAAELASVYHPVQDRSLSNTAGIFGTQLIWDGVANELKEFWPDIHRRLSRKKDKPQ